MIKRENKSNKIPTLLLQTQVIKKALQDYVKQTLKNDK